MSLGWREWAFRELGINDSGRLSDEELMASFSRRVAEVNGNWSRKCDEHDEQRRLASNEAALNFARANKHEGLLQDAFDRANASSRALAAVSSELVKQTQQADARRIELVRQQAHHDLHYKPLALKANRQRKQLVELNRALRAAKNTTGAYQRLAEVAVGLSKAAEVAARNESGNSPQDVAGATPAQVSTVAGSRGPEMRERGVGPALGDQPEEPATNTARSRFDIGDRVKWSKIAGQCVVLLRHDAVKDRVRIAAPNGCTYLAYNSDLTPWVDGKLCTCSNGCNARECDKL